MSTHLDRHALVRQANRRRVLDAVLEHGPVTRVEVAERTGLSKPTVNTLVHDFTVAGLLRAVGRTNGHVGRAATIFELNPGAGHVVGIDLGGTKVRVGVADLRGEIQAEVVVPTDRRGGRAVRRQLVDLAVQTCVQAGAAWDSVQVVVLGTPGVYDEGRDRLSLAVNIAGLERVPLVAELSTALGAPVVVDNDVNLAALGERWRGRAAGLDNFVFISAGTGVGMGVVAGGVLLRGARGAAGEVGYVPLGGDPFDPATRTRGAFEEAASGSGIVASAHRIARTVDGTRIRPDATAAHIFAAAAASDPLGRAVVAEEARLLALLITTVCAVLDPALVVLGGGIGSNPLLLDPVRAALAKLISHAPPVETSVLGERAALCGALAVGLPLAHDRLFQHV